MPGVRGSRDRRLPAAPGCDPGLPASVAGEGRARGYRYPSGVAGLQLVDYLQSVDTVVLPVLPSPIDIHATAHFIQDLLLIGKIRSRGVRLGIVANRVRENTLVFRDLERFLGALGIPLVALLRDSQNHMRAAQQGLAVPELSGRRIDPDRERWQALIDWLNQRTRCRTLDIEDSA